MTLLNTLARPPGNLPDSYREVLFWSLTNRPVLNIALQLVSIPVFLVSGLIFGRVALGVGQLEASLPLGLAEYVLLLICIPATIIFHELMHGTVIRLYGARPRFGMLWTQLMFYASAPGFAFSRNRYITMALVPVVFISMLVTVGMGLLPGSIWVPILGICCAFNVSMSVGDVWLSLNAMRFARDAFVIDERDTMRVFAPKL